MYDVDRNHGLTVASAGRHGFFVPVARSLTGHAVRYPVVGNPSIAERIPHVSPPKRLPNRHRRGLHGGEGRWVLFERLGGERRARDLVQKEGGGAARYIRAGSEALHGAHSLSERRNAGLHEELSGRASPMKPPPPLLDLSQPLASDCAGRVQWAS